MQFNFEELLDSQKGKFYLLSGRERDLDILQERLSEKNKTIVSKILRGNRCLTKESLFQEFAAALQFPYYFGNNWDAFDECISDLGGQSETKYVLFITNFDKILKDYSKDLKFFLNLLKDAIKQEAKDRKGFFHIIFHCEPENEKACKSILEAENISPVLEKLEPFDNIK